MGSAPDEDTPHARKPLLARGHLWAWLALAAMNAGFIVASVPRGSGGVGVRVLHHLYDVGHFLAAGLLVTAALEAWQRWGPRRPVWGYAATALCSIGVGVAVLSDDLDGVAVRLFTAGERWLPLLVVGVSLCIPAAALLGRLGARRLWLVPIPIAIALAVAAANQFILRNDYFGVHLYLAWGAATLLGGALAALPTPQWTQRLDARLGWAGRRDTVCRAMLALCAAASIVVRPGNVVMVDLFKLSGSVLVPFLALLHESSDDAPPPVIDGANEWYSDRSTAADIPPTWPPLFNKKPVVLLVVVDCLRADVVNGDAHARNLPNIRKLRNQSVVFTHARAPSSHTRPSMASVFTGKYYSQLVWKSLEERPGIFRLYPHEDPSPRFAELLSGGGIPTVLVAGIGMLTGTLGLIRGFKEEHFPRPGARVDELVPWLSGRIRRTGDQPLFLYTHFDDAHAPYDRAGKEGTPFERYIRELALVDNALPQIDAALRQARLLDRTVLILTADHGEAFDEHGDAYHGHTLYDELIRVPLLIRAPGLAPTSIHEDVSLIDLGSTILDLFGRPTPGAFMGQSLVPLLKGKNEKLDRPIAAESTRRIQSIVFPNGIKVIRDRRRGTIEVYDVKSDPAELVNLSDTEIARTHIALLSAFFSVHELRRPDYRVPTE